MMFSVIDTRTGKTPDIEKIALYENWADGLVYCDMEGFAIEEDGSLVLMDECGNHRYCPSGRFRVIWAAQQSHAGDGATPSGVEAQSVSGSPSSDAGSTNPPRP